MKTLFTHAKLIFPDCIRDDLLLTMENGVISEISQKHHYAGVDETVDVAGRYLSPDLLMYIPTEPADMILWMGPKMP